MSEQIDTEWYICIERTHAGLIECTLDPLSLPLLAIIVAVFQGEHFEFSKQCLMNSKRMAKWISSRLKNELFFDVRILIEDSKHRIASIFDL
jgi:hypothetical protein